MSNRAIVINGSAREHGNTGKAVVKLSPFAEYEMIQLCNLKINHYSYEHAVSGGDDFILVVEKMLASTDIVFATPVYWYAMSGQMKALFDRLTELITDKKPLGRGLKGKRCYLIACGTDDALPVGFEVPFQRTCEYFDMEFMSTTYLKTKD
jgi:multimeric flavodoxin WrbA